MAGLLARRSAVRLCSLHPGIVIAGTAHGFFGLGEEPPVLEAIRAAAPTLLLAGLGSPRQERWLDRHLPSLAVPVAIGVGGSLDVWAGRVARAPRVVQTLGLEWCYRLIRQPRRFGRQLAIPQFIATIWQERWRNGAR